jgi:hypothetical protein
LHPPLETNLLLCLRNMGKTRRGKNGMRGNINKNNPAVAITTTIYTVMAMS